MNLPSTITPGERFSSSYVRFHWSAAADIPDCLQAAAFIDICWQENQRGVFFINTVLRPIYVLPEQFGPYEAILHCQCFALISSSEDAQLDEFSFSYFKGRSFSAPSCSAAQPETAVQIAKGLLCIADVSHLHPSFPPSLGQLWTQMCVSRVRNGSGGAVGPRPPPGQLQPGKLHLPSDAAQHRQDCFRI